MKSLKIEYDGHKLVTLEIDGNRIDYFNSLRLVHESGGAPQLDIGFPVAGKDCITPPDVDRKSLESVQKRFGEGQIPLGGYPGDVRRPHKCDDGDQSDTPDDAA